MQGWTSPPSVSANVPYFELATRYNLASTKWDSVGQAAYISVDNAGSASDEFVSFDNQQTVAAKVAYARSKGHGGIAIWELAGGYLRNPGAAVRDPLIQALKQAMAGSVPPPATATPPPATATPTRTATATPRPATATPPPATVTAIATATRTATAVATATATATRTAVGPAPAAPAPAAKSLHSVYAESLSTPWRDRSWTATVDYRSAQRAYAGTTSIRVDQGYWGALGLRRGDWGAPVALPAASYSSLRFAIFGGASGLKLKIGAGNDRDGWFSAIDYGTVPANTWTVVNVPMTWLNPRALPIDSIWVGDTTGVAKTYYVDDISFVPPAAATAPIAAPPVSATPVAPPRALATPTAVTARPYRPTIGGTSTAISRALAAYWSLFRIR
jgi:hypothetical protein